MARQCTRPKRKRNAAWFKEKVLLVQAQAKGKELDEEQLTFLADPRVSNFNCSDNSHIMQLPYLRLTGFTTDLPDELWKQYMLTSDELTAMASKQSSSGPALHKMTHGTLSSGFVPQPPSSKPFVPPTRNDRGTAFLNISDQDAPSPSTSQTPQESPSHVIPPGAEEADHDIEVELVPLPDRVMIITLKCIYKVKLDEMGGVLKNKAWFIRNFIGITAPHEHDRLPNRLKTASEWHIREEVPCKGLGTEGHLVLHKQLLQMLIIELVCRNIAKRSSRSGSMPLLVPLPYAVTTSNIPDRSILTSDTTSSRSKWKMGWLSYTSSEQNISWQISLPRHWDKKDLKFLSTRLE
ncbi:hypothetical protein Tco_0829237 [Tanacetum coccineum]